MSITRSISGLSSEAVASYLAHGRDVQDFLKAFQFHTSVYRGRCTTDAKPGAGVRTGVALATDFVGTNVGSQEGFILVYAPSTASTNGIYQGFTVEAVGEDGEVLDDRYKTDGILRVRTSSTANTGFPYKITAPSGADVAATGVKAAFFLIGGRPEVDIYGTLEHNNFS